MSPKKSLSAQANAAASGLVSIIAEPYAEQRDEDVALLLEGLGAQNIRILASGYISASVPLGSIDQVEPVAHITLKSRKQPLQFQ